MAKPCTAILIDPAQQTVTSVEWDGDYRSIYTHIGADCFDAARFNKHGDAAFVDDEGLLKDGQFFFLIDGYPQPLAGKALILGCNSEGESIAPKVTLDEVKQAVSFGVPVPTDGGVAWFETGVPL